VFDDPETFDLSRANARQHVSFVQGPHGCLGLHLARMQTHAAIAGLLDHADDIELDPEASAGPRGLISRKAEAVRVRWSMT
jgi:cytochrome P450